MAYSEEHPWCGKNVLSSTTIDCYVYTKKKLELLARNHLRVISFFCSIEALANLTATP